MFMYDGGNFIDLYNKSMEIIESGESIKQIARFVKAIDGDVNNLENLIDKSLKL